MAVFEVDSKIKAPLETVFDAMADARNEPQWNSRVTRSELLTDEPIGAGTQFETVNRGQAYRATITTFDRPGRLQFEVVGKGMDITTTFAFTSTNDGTANHATFDFRPKGFMKAMFPLMRPLVAKDGPTQAANFARFVEGRLRPS
jgi:hypothetical protein